MPSKLKPDPAGSQIRYLQFGNRQLNTKIRYFIFHAHKIGSLRWLIPAMWKKIQDSYLKISR